MGSPYRTPRFIYIFSFFASSPAIRFIVGLESMFPSTEPSFHPLQPPIVDVNPIATSASYRRLKNGHLMIYIWLKRDHFPATSSMLISRRQLSSNNAWINNKTTLQTAIIIALGIHYTELHLLS